MESNHTQPAHPAAKKDRRESLWKWFRNHFHMRPPEDDDPQDWWFASQSIPLIAAAAGPLANVLSIVALTTPWRNNIHFDQLDDNGLPIQTGFPDPHWCTSLNATSLACGVVGNLFLLCNFTRMIRYIIALPASIILWSLATGILTGITASMHIHDPPIPPNQTFSQAYWSAVIAACLYFILCIILIINMLGYFLGHYPQHFILTDDQRTLILQTMAFMTWLTVGAAIFQNVMSISLAEALYFCDVTILTVGFGDVTPLNDVGKGLVMPYAVLGIIQLGLVVSSIHRFGQQLRYENVVRRHIERKRQITYERSVSFEPRTNGGAPTRLNRQATEIEYKPRHRRRPIRTAIAAFGRNDTRRQRIIEMREEKGRFDAMRKIQHDTVRFRRWTSLIASVGMFAVVWFGGAAVFWALEGVTYFNALYFGFCSLLTIGFGDITPKSNAGRPFFVVWSLIAVPTMTILISEMADTVIAGIKHATNVFADWTVLPQSHKYRTFLAKFPRLLSFVQHRAEKKRIAEGFQVGTAAATDEEQPGAVLQPQQRPTRNIEDLARVPAPSTMELAQQLAFAIRRTTKDALEDEPRRYTYEEWVEFTQLIRFTDSRPGTGDSGNALTVAEDEYGVLNWDWIGETSPLAAEQTEPQWVLERLCESLIRYLSMQESHGNRRRRRGHRRHDGDDDDHEEFTLRKERDIGIEVGEGEERS